jgi:putative transposase
MVQEQASPRQIIRLVRSKIYPQIKLKLHHNTQYSSDDLLDLLVHAAMTHDFTENSSNTLKLQKEKSPSADTLLYHIKKYSRGEINEMFEKCFERMFDLAKSYIRFSKPLDVAIDVTDQPYYGEYTDMVTGIKHQRGASYGFRFATIAIVENGKRFTLHAIPLESFSDKVKLLEELLNYAKKRIKIRHLYVDRAFFTIDVINLLKRMKITFVMPAKQTSRVKELIKKISSPAVIIYKLLGMKEEGGKRASATTNLVIINDQAGVKRLFATNLNVNPNHAWRLFTLYDKRWGIETSYRMKGMLKPRTTSRNYIIRLFYFMFSVCLYNLWVLANIIANVVFVTRSHKPILTAKIFGFWLYSYAIDTG